MKKSMHILFIASALMLTGSVSGAGFSCASTPTKEIVKQSHELPLDVIVVEYHADFSHALTFKITPLADMPQLIAIERTSASYRIPATLGGKPDTKRHFAWLARIIKLC